MPAAEGTKQGYDSKYMFKNASKVAFGRYLYSEGVPGKGELEVVAAWSEEERGGIPWCERA
ncbi:hypothetical protein IE53DRAFT_110177 [Violaceomyces palustris]|uniref:Uncharacterized protein n=1 Tax=Violaceomyces palustris TaxID=1673888 RepID=A0ACD0NWM0_9BASI|nr:hypothetical protein IE53DRAFT_110177 [Violaceomyces palustris]